MLLLPDGVLILVKRLSALRDVPIPGTTILVGGLNDHLADDRGDDALFAGNDGSTLPGREGKDQF